MDSSQRNIGITIKNTAERDAMREAGRAAAQVLLRSWDWTRIS